MQDIAMPALSNDYIVWFAHNDDDYKKAIEWAEAAGEFGYYTTVLATDMDIEELPKQSTFAYLYALSRAKLPNIISTIMDEYKYGYKFLFMQEGYPRWNAKSVFALLDRYSFMTPILNKTIHGEDLSVGAAGAFPFFDCKRIGIVNDTDSFVFLKQWAKTYEYFDNTENSQYLDLFTLRSALWYGRLPYFHTGVMPDYIFN